MSRWNVSNLRLQGKAPLAAAAAVLIALGAGGGAAAVSMTRPTVTMAPTNPTAIAKLASTSGIVSAKGRVTEVFGDRFVVQDRTGRAMVAGSRDAMPSVGSNVLVQGRYDDGVMHAQYLVDPNGSVVPVGPPPPRPGAGPRGDGPPPPPGGPRGDAPPPPPPGGGWIRWPRCAPSAPAGWLRTGCGAAASAGEWRRPARSSGSAARACRGAGSGSHRRGSPGGVIRP